MRILQICHRVPYPAVDGGNIAMMNMALALIEDGHEVHQFAFNTSRHFIDPETIPLSLKEKLHFHCTNIDTRIKFFDAFKNLFTNDSYNIIRFYSKEIQNEIEKLLQAYNFDVVQFETLFTTPYIECIRKNSSAKIVLRAHNVEHIIWKRLAEREPGILKKMYLKFLVKRIKKYETKILNDIDALIPITSVDETVFRNLNYKGPMISLPLSIEMKDYPSGSNASGQNKLFHLGSMDWLPNIEAVNWFLENCWNDIQESSPEVELFLAGRNFPEDIRERNYPRVFCDGRVEDAYSYMLDKQIMIVPLLSGSGMRVKIIQGMALAKTIISTSIGAEGIPAMHEKNILIADSPKEFVALVKKCVDQPEWSKQIGLNARKFVQDHYSNASIGHQLGNFYKALIKLHPHSS